MDPGGRSQIILWADLHVQSSPWGQGVGSHNIVGRFVCATIPMDPGGGGHIILWVVPHVLYYSALPRGPV